MDNCEEILTETIDRWNNEYPGRRLHPDVIGILNLGIRRAYEKSHLELRADILSKIKFAANNQGNIKISTMKHILK